MINTEVVEDLASRSQQRLALLMSVALIFSVLLIVPHAALPLTKLPHISGMYGAATAMIDLATFWLLISAPRQLRSHAIIAAAYLFAALMALLHVLTFPGAVVPGTSVIGSPHAVSLLFIAWRAGFAALIVWAVVVAGMESTSMIHRADSTPHLIAVLIATAAFAASQESDAAALTTVSGKELFSTFSLYGSYASAVLAVVATLLIWYHKLYRRTLFVWLVVVLIAEAAGVWLSTFSGGRYTLAWYTTRIEGLVANTVVLVLLAGHFRKLQLSLSQTVAALQRRTDNLQAEIHRRERAEVKLAQAQKLEAVGQLGAGLAHDLNNILQVITGRLAILKRRAGNAVDSDVEMIRRNVRKAEALTRQLTLLSGRRNLSAKPLDIATELPAIAEELRSLLGPMYALELHIDEDLPSIAVDPLELEIALTNLATNAKDALPIGGSIEIAVFETERVRGRPALAIQFRDSGVGMAPELLERVFEPFFTTKEPGRGTGLGLLQVHGFVSASGGSVTVESMPGSGTTVTMQLPVHVAESMSSRSSDAATTASGLRAGQVVLLVDDNDEVRDASAQLLMAEGCVVRAVAGAAEALELLVGGLRPNLMISDVVMPGGLDGVELACRALALFPDLQVVLVTGLSDAAARARAEGLSVVLKPYDLTSLVRGLPQ